MACGPPNVDTLGVRGGERAQLSALLLAKLASGEIPAAEIKAAMG